MYKLTRDFLQVKEDNLTVGTILISGVMEKVLLEALRKLNRTEIDIDVISEIVKVTKLEVAI